MQPNTLGIDPGNTHSAGVVVTSRGIANFCYLPNDEFIPWMLHAREEYQPDVICEMIASYGMPVGREVFETCVFIGRLTQLFPTMKRVTRIQVKSTICHSARATDANIRQALIDLYGPAGRKATPGPTFGISGDVWAALAVASAFRAGCSLYSPTPDAK